MKQISKIFALILLTGALALSSTAQQNNPDNNTVVVRIGATSLTAADFDKREAGDLLQARFQMYQSERKVLDHFIDDQILELQARKEGLTVDQLLEKEAYKGIKDPTDDQMEVFYEGIYNETQPFPAIRDQILDHIREVRRSKARTAYIERLRNQSNVQVMLEPPKADVDAHSWNVRGSK
ncbi:MAG: hypothetical protein ACRD2S_03830, partial [Terriglobales bacterium]